MFLNGRPISFFMLQRYHNLNAKKLSCFEKFSFLPQNRQESNFLLLYCQKSYIFEPQNMDVIQCLFSTHEE